MNCCDEYGDCRQGRNCPARAQACKHCHGIGYDASGLACTCTGPAKVARVKNRHHAKAPLPNNMWRAYMRHLAKWMLIVWALLISVPMIVSLTSMAKGVA
jgi:hypothetical protein